MKQALSFAIPVKVFAVLCTIVATALTGNVLLTCILAGLAFLQLAMQKKTKTVIGCGVFYGILALLLYLIRFHGLHMILFSEFYILMFWNLFPVFLASYDLVTSPPGEISAFLSKLHAPTGFILGLLVVFRFFPTMRSELSGVVRSMKNRGLTGTAQVLAHPLISMEYVLVPMLLRILQIADQLSVSAVARGAECPGIRGSYYGKSISARDIFFLLMWIVGTCFFFAAGGVR